MDDRLILMGVIGHAHGVRGAVHVTAYTQNPRQMADYSLTDGDGRYFRLSWIGNGIARIAEIIDTKQHTVSDRAAAEHMTNLRLYAERKVLPEPDADEFYLVDLIGLAARDASGTPVGRVAVVHDYGAGASLEIASLETLDFAPSVIVPFTRTTVPEIDIGSGYLVIAQPIDFTAKGPS